MQGAGALWQTRCAIRDRRPVVLGLANPLASVLSPRLLQATGGQIRLPPLDPDIAHSLRQAEALVLGLEVASETAAESVVSLARDSLDLARPWVLNLACCAAGLPWSILAERLSHLQPAVICGNGSEIVALGTGSGHRVPDFDSPMNSAEALDAAQSLARGTGAVVAVTGAVDYVTDGTVVRAVANGHRLLATLPGQDTAVAFVIAAASAVTTELLAAATHGLALVGLAAQRAAETAAGPGSFTVALLDEVYGLDEAAIKDGARIE